MGVTIVLENLPFGGSDPLEHIAEIMERVPLLRFHLDSGHAKLERGYDRWDEYLSLLGNKLLHVHISENDGTADQHLPPGAAPRSTTDWPDHIRKLKATGYDGTITLEVFSPQKSICSQAATCCESGGTRRSPAEAHRSSMSSE